MQKRAIVLGGGGARGAYQVGAYRALQEQGYHFDIVVGTSIGALNGALIAQNDIDAMNELWEHMELDQVIQIEEGFDFSIDSIMHNKNKIAPILKSYVKEFGMDTNPLQSRIREMANPQKIHENHVTFGCVSTKYPSLHACEITLDEMEDEQLADYLIASSACFPIFPKHEINHQEYIDGGYYDNVPIQFALRLQATELVVIDLQYPKIEHPEYENQPNILTIRPSQDTGNFLRFSHDHFQQLMQLGYLDALRALKQRKGFKYTFHHVDSALIHQTNLLFIQSIQQADINSVRHKRVIQITSCSPFTDGLNSVIRYHDDESYFLQLLEMCGNILHMDPLQDYDFYQYIQSLLQKLENLDEYQFPHLIPSSFSALTELKEYLLKLDVSFLLGYLIRQITISQQDLSKFMLIIPEYIICAFFIHTLFLVTKKDTEVSITE